MKTLILLIFALLLTGVSFYHLFKNKHSKGERNFEKAGLFLGIFSLAVCWFNLFFPEVRPWGSPNLTLAELRILFWGSTVCVGSWGMAAFWPYVYLWYKKGHENDKPVVKLLLAIMSLSFVPLIILLTVVTKNNFKPISYTISSAVSKPTPPSPEIPKMITPPAIQLADEPSSLAVTIPQGGSLCGTLGMKPDEALLLAKKYRLRYWYKSQKLIVLVYPGDIFLHIDGVWKAVKIWKGDHSLVN